MAGDGDCIRSRDSTEMDFPPEKKPKIETDPEAKIAEPRGFMRNGRFIRLSGRNDPECKRQIELFYQQFDDSEGFDLEWDSFDYKFGVLNFDWLSQFDDDMSNEELMEKLIQAAIEDYDENYDTQLESAKYVSANLVGCKGYMYYITFSAIDVLSSDQEPKLYQAKVHHFCDEITVKMTRPRLSKKRI